MAAPAPWECPRCHAINAPHSAQCDCVPLPADDKEQAAIWGWLDDPAVRIAPVPPPARVVRAGGSWTPYSITVGDPPLHTEQFTVTVQQQADGSWQKLSEGLAADIALRGGTY